RGTRRSTPFPYTTLFRSARMNLHERYMRRCLDLARMAQKNVSPNPMVGAVIVVDNKIVGEGHTSAYGGSHAEVNAVEDVLQTYRSEEHTSELQSRENLVC